MRAISWPFIAVGVVLVFGVFRTCVWYNRKFGKPLTMSQSWMAEMKTKEK